jgi:N-acetylmuramic acid 6-phosphate etherase
MTSAAEKAREFLEQQKAFRLGELLTESSHPKTRDLSQTMESDVSAGIRLLQAVDQDIPAALDRIFGQDTFVRLVETLRDALRDAKRIFFTGCGATGRLAILLEATWRRFWRDVQQRHPSVPSLEDRCVSVMAGGDFALIKAVEGFEDFPDFGRYQLSEAGVQKGDVVVAITEGGETPFVIGTAWQGLEAGAHVFFVYNNPTDDLCRHVQRSREVIEEPRIGKLDLTTGPMAITGSTRMQATTVELLVVGAALETALAQVLQDVLPKSELTQFGVHERCPEQYHRTFATLLKQLEKPEAVDTIARLTQFEADIYRKRGLVTYAANSVLLDVLTDTTERSPTFMVPPFRRKGDVSAPPSWAFVKNPFYPSELAWREMLGREPRGLTWGPQVYEKLKAPMSLQTDPPKLDNEEVYRFRIGNEPDTSRTDAADAALVVIGTFDEAGRGGLAPPYKTYAAITMGPGASPLDVDEHFHFSCDLPASPLRLWEHLAVKLVLNTVSTATMVKLGRVIGNAMVWVSPSNKKLIDRGTRLIAEATGCSYERACEVLHETMEEIAGASYVGREPPSPVALAIERIANKQKPRV